MTMKQALENIWAVIGDIDVKFIVVPLPPRNDGQGNIYMPDCFTSKSFDLKFDHNPEFKVYQMTVSRKYGPIVVAECKFSRLLHFCDISCGKDHMRVQSRTNSVCAEVAAYNLFEDNHITFADRVTINRFNFGSSCHPHSHYVIPDAPHITALIQYERSSALSFIDYQGKYHSADGLVDKKMDFMTPDDAKVMFPNWNWGINKYLDEIVKYCPTDPTASFFNTFGGIQKWATEPLRMMRKNALKKGEVLYEHFCKSEIFSHKVKANLQGNANSQNPTVDQGITRQEDRLHQATS